MDVHGNKGPGRIDITAFSKVSRTLHQRHWTGSCVPGLLSSGWASTNRLTWCVNDGQVGTELVLDAHNNLLAPKLLLLLQALVFKVNILLHKQQRSLATISACRWVPIAVRKAVLFSGQSVPSMPGLLLLGHVCCGVGWP